MPFYHQFFYLIERLGEGFHNKFLAGKMRKVDPNEIISLECFAFVRWYGDMEVPLESTDEAEHLVGWGCKVILMYHQ